MGRQLILLILVLLFAGGLAFVLLGGDSRPTADDVTRGDGDGPAPDLADADGAARGDAASEAGSGVREAGDGPVLFGRPMRRERGPGALSGKAVDASTGQPVVGARILLTGKGFGDVDVLLRAKTSEGGSFRVADVPAGEGYSVRVVADGLPERVVGANVERGALTALGTIWLGAAGGLEGRVVGSDGRPVAGADVRVHEGRFDYGKMMSDFMEMVASLDQEPPFVARTTTDAGGAFRFDELAPGAVTLTVNAEGFTQGSLTTVVSDATTSQKALVIRLDPGLVVAGRVVDETERGVAGARLAVISGNEPDAFLYGRTFSETAADGAFRVDTVRAKGDVRILCTAAGYPTIFHEAQPGETDVVIALERGATVELQILTEPDDAPVVGATVMVAVGDDPGLGAGGPGSLVSGRTDAEGRARFATPPGHVKMVVLTHGEQGSGMWIGGRQMIPGAMKGPSDVTVKEGANAFVFRMPRSRVITGRVTATGGTPIAGARVSSAMLMPGAAKPVLTDGEGRYRLVVPPMGGMAMVLVRAEGWVQDQKSMVVTVKADAADTLEHDVELARAAVISGRVTSPEGRPVAGARVRLHADDSGGMGYMSMLGAEEAISGKDGRYVLDGAKPGGKVRVMARHPDFIDSATESFDVDAGEMRRSANVAMNRGTELVVRVEAPDGRPLGGARVELSFDRDDDVQFDAFEQFSDDASRTSDERGRVEAGPVPPGTVTVTASHAEHASSKTAVPVTAGAERPVEAVVRLLDAMVVEGRVVDAAGQALAGVHVAVMPGETGASDFAGYETDRSDAEGRFRLGGLPRGTVRLRVTHGGYVERDVEQSGPTTDLRIVMQREDPALAARRAALNQKIQEAYAALLAAENDAERTAAQQELQRIQQELSELPSEDADTPRPAEQD